MPQEFNCASIVDDMDYQKNKGRNAMFGIRQTLTACAAILLLAGAAGALVHVLA